MELADPRYLNEHVFGFVSSWLGLAHRSILLQNGSSDSRLAGAVDIDELGRTVDEVCSFDSGKNTEGAV